MSRPSIRVLACVVAGVLSFGLEARGQLACDGPINASRSPSTSDKFVETSISVDPTDPRNQIIAVTRPGGRTSPAYRSNIIVLRSNDAGRTWEHVTVPASTDPSVDDLLPNSDPVVTHGPGGRVYVTFTMLQTPAPADARRGIGVAVSDDGGRTFATTVVDEDVEPGAYLDKPFVLADAYAGSPGLGNVYLVWVDTRTTDRCFFSRQVGGEGAWSPRQEFSQSCFFPGMATGPDGSVYAAWWEWGSGDRKVRFLDLGVEGQDLSSNDSVVIADIGDLLPTTIDASPHRSVYSVPSVGVDRSGGPRHGRVWFAYNDYPHDGSPEKMDVFVKWWEPGTILWLGPVRLGEPDSPQFLPWLSVDDSDGSVGVLYYSGEDDPDPGRKARTHLYHRAFVDGDETDPAHWPKRRLSAALSDASAHPTFFDYREYVSLSQQGNVSRAAWTSITGGDPGETYYARFHGPLTQVHSSGNDEPGDRFGDALAAGDFDGDGFDDVAVGVPFEDDAVMEEGRVVVHYGSAEGLFPARAERLGEGLAGSTAEAGDHFGFAVAAGDFDGDGFDDLAVGVPDEDGEAVDDGRVIVFFGSADGLNPVRTQFLTQSDAGLPLEPGDRFGTRVAAGDFDGDGHDDLAVASPTEDFNATEDGAVNVFYGSPAGLVTGSGAITLIDNTAGGTSESGDHFGDALAVGDFDGDGRDDLAIGIPDEDDQATDDGNVAVFFGGSSGLLPANVERISQVDGGRPSENGDRFGAALAAGDFDGSGHDDLAVGVPDEFQNAPADGTAIVFYGSSAGLVPASTELLTQTSGGETMEAGDRFSAALATGDFDGDGHFDLAVGVPGEDDLATDEGLAIVYFGSADGLLPARVERVRAGDAGGAAEDGDRLGAQVASADVNGDCIADLLIAAPDEDVASRADAGTVHVLGGSSRGLLPGPTERWLGDANCDGCVDWHDRDLVASQIGSRGVCGADLDGSGLVDEDDVALVLAGCGGGVCTGPCTDGDCDGFGTSGSADCPIGSDDCDDGDSSTWSVPGEARRLSLVAYDRLTTDTSATWDEPLDNGGQPGSEVYDLVRSAAASDFLGAGECVVTDSTSMSATFRESAPVRGSARFYLVRAANGCGEGTAGSDTAGTERSAPACP